MHILLIQLTLHIPMSHSLKDKRRQIKSLKDRISQRFNAAVAEVGELDNWQTAELAICMLSKDKSWLDSQYSLIETLLLDYPELELQQIQRQWL
ncbi:MAG TPA: DUF503 domain-containing protein [Gammaproteobacteria bacterium]